MAISSEKLNQARQEGFTDDQILQIFLEDNPKLNNKVKTAKDQRFSSSQILDILSEQQKTKQNEISKTSESAQDVNQGLIPNILQSGALGFLPGLISETLQGSTSDQDPNIPGPFQSSANALISGLVKGTGELGRMMGPLIPSTTEEQQQIEQFPRQVEDFFPTNEGFASNVIERGGELFPLIASGGSSNIPEMALRTGAASLTGQTAKKAGLGEIGQTVGELIAFGIPKSLFKNRIAGKSAQQDLIEFLREQGLTEEQIAPALNSPEGLKARFFPSIARRGTKVQSILKDSKKAIGEIFNGLRARPEAQTTLTFQEGETLISKLNEILRDLPTSTRQKILGDFREFRSSARSGSDIINFWQDINDVAKGKYQKLGRLKEPLVESLEIISPELAQDFQLTNKAYGNVANIAKKLSPRFADAIINRGEVGALVFGLISGNLPLIGEVVGVEAARQLATKALLKPRFQNLLNNFVNAINNNKIGIAQSLQNQMREELVKIDPNSAILFDQLNLEELIEENR